MSEEDCTAEVFALAVLLVAGVFVIAGLTLLVFGWTLG
jgi:hypothetical protein